MIYLGVDIGGTDTKIGLVENGKIIDRMSIPTSKNFDFLTDDIANSLNLLMKNNNIEKIDGVGVGCPGAINSEKGIVDIAYNLGWKNVPLKEMLEKKISAPIKVSNDANVAGLGEAKYGAGKGKENIIVVTLGTGVGGAIILNGKLFEGNEGKGAELGHIVLRKDGRKCSCGRKGCVEAYCSAREFLNGAKILAQKYPESLLGKRVNADMQNRPHCKTIYECADLGDEVAVEYVNEYISYLGEFVLDICNIFRPDMIIFGGGMSYSGDLLKNRVIDYCEVNNYGFENTPKVQIEIAKLQNDAGIIGGACLFE